MVQADDLQTGSVFVRMCKLLGVVVVVVCGMWCAGGESAQAGATLLWLAWPETAGLLPARLWKEERGGGERGGER